MKYYVVGGKRFDTITPARIYACRLLAWLKRYEGGIAINLHTEGKPLPKEYERVVWSGVRDPDASTYLGFEIFHWLGHGARDTYSVDPNTGRVKIMKRSS